MTLKLSLKLWPRLMLLLIIISTCTLVINGDTDANDVSFLKDLSKGMKPSSLTKGLLLFYLVLCTFSSKDDSKKNSFWEREASDASLGYPEIDEAALVNSKCPKNLELRWQTKVSSSIFTNPMVADINSDGKLDIVVPSFVHYLEVLEGIDGDKMPGDLGNYNLNGTIPYHTNFLQI